MSGTPEDHQLDNIMTDCSWYLRVVRGLEDKPATLALGAIRDLLLGRRAP